MFYMFRYTNLYSLSKEITFFGNEKSPRRQAQAFKLFIKLFSRIFDVSLSCRKACDGHAVRRAGNVVETDCVAELD